MLAWLQSTIDRIRARADAWWNARVDAEYDKTAETREEILLSVERFEAEINALRQGQRRRHKGGAAVV